MIRIKIFYLRPRTFEISCPWLSEKVVETPAVNGRKNNTENEKNEEDK